MGHLSVIESNLLSPARSEEGSLRDNVPQAGLGGSPTFPLTKKRVSEQGATRPTIETAHTGNAAQTAASEEGRPRGNSPCRQVKSVYHAWGKKESHWMSTSTFTRTWAWRYVCSQLLCSQLGISEYWRTANCQYPTASQDAACKRSMSACALCSSRWASSASVLRCVPPTSDMRM